MYSASVLNQQLPVQYFIVIHFMHVSFKELLCMHNVCYLNIALVIVKIWFILHVTMIFVNSLHQSFLVSWILSAIPIPYF